MIFLPLCDALGWSDSSSIYSFRLSMHKHMIIICCDQLGSYGFLQTFQIQCVIGCCRASTWAPRGTVCACTCPSASFSVLCANCALQKTASIPRHNADCITFAFPCFSPWNVLPTTSATGGWEGRHTLVFGMRVGDIQDVLLPHWVFKCNHKHRC